MKTEREIAHQMVDYLFDHAAENEDKDTIFWENCYIDNLELKRTTYRLTFSKYFESAQEI